MSGWIAIGNVRSFNIDKGFSSTPVSTLKREERAFLGKRVGGWLSLIFHGHLLDKHHPPVTRPGMKYQRNQDVMLILDQLWRSIYLCLSRRWQERKTLWEVSSASCFFKLSYLSSSSSSSSESDTNAVKCLKLKCSNSKPADGRWENLWRNHFNWLRQ